MVMRQKPKGKENVNPQSGVSTKTLPRVRDINRDDYKLVQFMNCADLNYPHVESYIS